MTMKMCPDCGCDQPIEEFSFKNTEKGTRQAYCNEHRRMRDRSRYQTIRQSVISKTRARQEKHRLAVADWRCTFKCSNCSEDDPCCIDFHHLDPSTKELSIAMMKSRGYSLQRVMEEAQKCIPLCSNCHRKVHAGKLVI